MSWSAIYGREVLESEETQLEEMVSYVRSTFDLTNRVQIRWIMDVSPHLAQRLFPQEYIGRIGHNTIENTDTPFSYAISEGPISVLRYFWRLARRAMSG